MSDPKLDAQLRAYLEDAAGDKAEGNTIANLRLARSISSVPT